MCGIVGYIGKKNATPILIDGLKRLEYRGYDSVGISVLTKEGLKYKKTRGRILDLTKKLALNNFSGHVGISHTRWSTHGEPIEENAHPHFDCKKQFAIVHNGIIENYMTLKKKLLSEKHRFYSETDTEVIAHLIEKYYKGNLCQAVQQALMKVEGTYGLAVISTFEPDKIIAARHGSPLIIGLGEGENFIASDVQALIPYTKKVIYPDDGELVEISTSSFSTVTIDDRKVKKKIEDIDSSQNLAYKNGFTHFMLKEIFEQPKVVKNACAGRIVPQEGLAHLGGLDMKLEELRQIKRILFLGCGTAYYAGLVGKYMIEEVAAIPCDVEFASEFRYKRVILDPTTLVFAISQSGETADTICAMREIQRKGIKVLGISNIVGSTIARETDGGVYIHAGPEISVASSKAFMGQITVLAILALEFGRLKSLSFMEGREIALGLRKIPDQINEILKKNEKIKKLAKKYLNFKNFLFLGRKFNLPIAQEGALKLKELSYVHAEGCSSGEMKHGPLALIDKNFPTVVIAPKDSVYEKTMSNIEEIKARKGKILVITTEDNEEIEKFVDDVIFIPRTLEMLEPLLTIVPLQLFAYHIANLKGRDIDKPRNLAKSVTVE